MIAKLLGFRNVILALAAGLLIGAGAGYYLKARFVAADQLEAIKEQRAQDARVAADTQKRETELVVTETRENAFQSDIRVEASRIAPVQPSKPVRQSVRIPAGASHVPDAPKNQDVLVCPDDPLLDRDLVRLLNDARRGASAARERDDQVGAASATP